MRTWKPVALVAVLAAVGVLALTTGCSNDGNEFQRLVCEVSAINGGAPLVSGYLEVGSDKIAGTADDTFPIDVVEVEFHARPYNSSITSVEDFPYSYFHVTSYDLIWHPLTPDGDPLVNYNYTRATTDCLVPVTDNAAVSILIADRFMKDQAWFAELYLGSRPSFTAVCELRFYGHETGSDREIMVPASFMATFVGAIVED